MQNEEQLNKLFNLAREQEVLLNSNEIQGLINAPGISKYQKFKTKKIKAMTFTTLILAIAGTIGYFMNTKQKSFHKTPAEIVKTIIEPLKDSTPELKKNEEFRTIISPANIHSEPKPEADDTGKKKKMMIEKRMIISDEEIVIDKKPDRDSKVFFIENMDTGKKEMEFMVKKIVMDEPGSETKIAPGFEKETFVHLSKEYLKKLGIFIKDDIMMYEMKNTRVGDIKCFAGGEDNEKVHSLNSSTGNNPLALFATLLNGEIIMANDDMDNIQEKSSTMLPIWVEDYNSTNKKTYIVWFEINNILIDILPVSVQNNLKSRQDFYKHSIPDRKKEIINFTIDSVIPGKFNSYVSVDANQILIPDETLLKKLGFNSVNPIKYSRTFNKQKLSVDIYNLNRNFNSNNNGEYKSGKTIKDIFPSFITSYYPKTHQISYPKGFIEGSRNPDINIIQLFENKRFGLIGFSIKSGIFDYVFWYEPSEALLKEIPETDRKKIEEYIAANKGVMDNISINIDLPKEKSFAEIAAEGSNTNKLFEKETFVTLNKEELKRLGIYIKDDVFMYEMNDTRLGNFKSYFGEKTFASEIWQTPKQNPGGTNPLAMFTTTLNGEIKNVLGIFHSPSKVDAKAMAPTLLPIWVEDEKSATKKAYIAWFEINDKLLSLLPASVKSNIENNKYFYKHSLPDLTIEEHNFKTNDTSHFNSVNFVSIDNEQTITPDNNLLNKLGFSSINPIIFKRQTGENRLSINSDNRMTNIDFNFGNKDSINKKIENTYPVFMTNYDPRTHKVFDISYLNEYFDLMKDINIPVFFNSKQFKMLGLMIEGTKPNKIFWYDINDIILNELNPEDKRRIKEYAEVNKDNLKDISININLPKEKSFAEIANSETTIHKPFQKETFAILSKDELKRLGVFIKDSAFMYEMDYTRIGKIEFFTGGKNTDYRSMLYSRRNGKNPLGVFVTNSNGDIIKPIIHLEKYTDDYLVKISKNLLPVWVEDKTSKAAKPYIAWFEINDTLIHFLPQRIQQKLSSDKTYYSHLLTDKNKRNGDIKYPKQTIAVDKNQIVVPDKALLDKLGFESTNPVVYYRHTKLGGQLAIDYRWKDGHITSSLDKQDGYEHTISTMFPAFESDYSPKEESIYRVHAFTGFVKRSWDFNERQYFENKKYGMVGLLIKGDSTDKIFWYDINEALLNELKPEDRKRIKEHAEANKDNLKGMDLNTQKPEDPNYEEVANGKTTNTSAIKTITLSDAQLAKLLIRVVNNTILKQIPDKIDKKTGKQLAVELGFKKNGTELRLLGITLENFDSASYVRPEWISDDLGTWSRASFDTIYNVLDKISTYNLIPVLVKSGEEYTTMDQLTKKHRPDLIFWYKPTEKFLKILDNKTAGEIRNDIVALSCNRSKITFTTDSSCDGKSIVSCNYFEACQNTKSKAISKYSVFPNPAKDKFNLKLDLKEECSVLVYMFALNGAEVKQYPIGKMKGGISQKELSSEGIIPGLYLLRITTDKGDVFNERILIKE